MKTKLATHTAPSGTKSRRFGRLFSRVLAVLLSPAGTLCAGIITFDEPGYVPGQRPPAPWFTHGDLSGWASPLVQVTGAAGSRYLSVQDAGSGGENGYYPLPRPLTSADGAQRIVVRIAPAHRGCDYGTLCGVVGLGYAVGTPSVAANWVNFFDWAPPGPLGASARRINPWSGEIFGESLGTYVPGDWHEVTFDLNEKWTQLTISMKRPDGSVSSVVEPVSSKVFDCIICGGSQNHDWAAGPALFDDLRWPKYLGVFDAIIPVTSGMELRMFGELGQVYDLEHATDLGGAWQTLTTLTNTAWTMSYTDLAATNTARFYRLREIDFTGTGGVLTTNLPLGPELKKFFRLKASD